MPNLSVVENVILGTDAGFVLRLGEAERRVGEMLRGFGMTISPRTEVRHLSLGQQQRVEILKVLYRGSRVLLLDEPTSVLTPVEAAALFETLLRLKADGVAVVLITHKLDEALEVSDRISVLRQGRKVGELGPEQLAGTDRAVLRQRVVELMFGGLPPPERPLGAEETASERGRGEAAVLSLHGVSAKGNRGGVAVRNVTLDLRAGEVFGIAGVDGNGQKELGEVIAGQRATAGGQVLLGRAEITNKGDAAAAKAGIGYVTDDRLGEGCVASASVAENLVLKSIGEPPYAKGPVLDWVAIEAHARELIREFDVRTPSPWTRVSLLSGGNIQKLLLARELSARPKLLVCNKPTAGLDVKTARFVLRTLRERADAGMTVLLISSELDELMEISDRIGVMYNGRLVASFARDEADPETIGRLMLGVGIAERAA